MWLLYIAGSVHLMISNLGRKGGAWPHPKQHHPVPQGPPFSSIDWPPEVHRQSHLNHTASSRPKHTKLLHVRAATPPAKELTTFTLGAEQQHPIATIYTSRHHRLLSGRTAPVYTASLTDMLSPLTADGSTWLCSKVTPCRRHAHPSLKSSRSLHRQSTGS
jgi:hypothetical protein